ncbi:MAG: fused MFS/spermidine synthase [Bacteroidetes bacterium]|nr:fused MFS/spermidine synthase [Bacteroidota bacterium]
MKKLLSYLFPITQKIETHNNGMVEITYDQGKKLLDSANANYSYGSLQRILNFGLQQIDLNKTQNVLLLGLGGGGVIKNLRENYHYYKKITAVEIDDIIIQIAFKEFNIKPNENLELIHQDALQYVRTTKKKFDLIIIDLFIDNKVPNAVYGLDFWGDICNVTHNDGIFLFNASTIVEMGNDIDELKILLSKMFTVEQFDMVEGSNTLLIGIKNRK